MTGLVFVDTNILVYARDAGEPAKQRVAARWLGSLWQQQIGRTSVQVLNEYYVTLTRKLKPGVRREDAWDDVRAFMTWEPQTLDNELMVRAQQVETRYRTSWWDALVIAAAQLQNCSVLLSEDFQDGMEFGQVVVRSPFSTGVEEQRAVYSPSVSTRHRSRGRPARAAVG